MDYEKAYTDALLRAKQAIKDCGHNEGRIRMIEDIFPELASKDEKIRKYLLMLAERCPENSIDFMGEVKKEDVIAWLEKQGERNSADSYCQENCKGYKETGKCFADGKCKAKRDAERNPMWSEEDEKIMKQIDSLLYCQCTIHSSMYEKLHNWLKSLEPQPQWKPTQEQMNCFKQAIDLFKMKVNDDLVLQNLHSLYNDLKKL